MKTQNQEESPLCLVWGFQTESCELRQRNLVSDVAVLPELPTHSETAVEAWPATMPHAQVIEFRSDYPHQIRHGYLRVEIV
jgi:hypothetical protein